MMACSGVDKQASDALNDASYNYRYRNLDSTEVYAQRAFDSSDRYADGRAEALNNMAFVCIAKMDYKQAWQLLTEAMDVTANQIELLVTDVQFMRLCQRMSRNREFYEYRERAARRLSRIDEERSLLTSRELARLVYAESEYAIVNSTYYYYVGLELQSIDAISAINSEGDIQKDTAQYLSYLYNVGSGGIITKGSQYDISQKEFELLMQGYVLALQSENTFYTANTLEALAEHLLNPDMAAVLMANNPLSMRYLLSNDSIMQQDVAVVLAEKALQLFSSYGDVYQIAGANRTLASCHMAIGNYERALVYLEQALSDERILQAPDLVASIREQLSVAYSAVNDKPASDYNRNIYIELQEQTRQDRSLEARADMLDKASVQLNLMITAVLIAILVLLLLLWLFYRWNNKHKDDDTLETLLQPLRQWKEDNQHAAEALSEQQEELNERLMLLHAQTHNNQLKLLEHRTRLSLVNTVTPFIDRIIHEISQLRNRNESDDERAQRHQYVIELTDKINEYNDVLTRWIEMRKGEVSMRIETFPLQQIFDILSRSKTSFSVNGITLNVEPTLAVVKADRVLTLFMLNTLADNARKFTPSGGHVTISATEADEYVEISVQDTGIGLSETELEQLFEHKVYNGHGYGLMNCKGIIEKYRKTSSLFSHCRISAQSEQGRGSRFYFRLPRGIKRALLAMLIALLSPSAIAADVQMPVTNLSKANNFADSTYLANINGHYDKALAYADSCRKYLNRHYLESHPNGRILMKQMADASGVAPEILWLRDSVAIDYQIILDVRNESAVAALALHNWALYEYNNRIYTQLFKEISADNTLADYCRTMQQSQTNKNIAIIILIIILVMIIPAYYLLYYRHRIYYRFCVEKVKQINDALLSQSPSDEKLQNISRLSREQYPQQLQDVVQQIMSALHEAESHYHSKMTEIEMAEDECRKAEFEYNNLYVCNSVLDNCLSTLKHETMYYPSRLRQLMADDGRDDSLAAVSELVAYYRDIHSVLSQQAMRQLDHVKLHMSKVSIHGATVIGNKPLLEYMFSLLLKYSGQSAETIQCSHTADGYVRYTIPLSAGITEQQAKDMFNPAATNFSLMLCRQIVRDHSEYTNRRRCGIEAVASNDAASIRVYLASG